MMSAGQALFGQKRACPKCGETVEIPYPTQKDEDMEDIMAVLMGGDQPRSPNNKENALTNFYRPPSTMAGGQSKQRRCHNCKKLNPANYRYCGNCKEQLSLTGG
jgi:RNA polymerase subunit RPABC4/transcription elongation factor Spt4